jgi:murein DD-endopeptidase MepM/ murein hydrolase activator NlpD
MQFSRKILLTCAMAALAFATWVCSTGYITPGSLAETEQAEEALSASATALYALLGPTSPPRTPIAEATATAAISPTPAGTATAAAPFVYVAQSGDTLAALSVRFGVDPAEFASPQDIPSGLIDSGQIFTIPNLIGATGPNENLLPDSEVVFSPSTIGFNTASYVGRMAGYLADYREYLPSDWYSGAGVIDRVALEHSVNPRLLLSVLQEQSNWVLGQPLPENNLDYPMGYVSPQEKGLYHQLSWAARQLSVGYYSWRDGRLTELHFKDGTTLRIAPDLNAGTVALQYLFSQLYSYGDWLELMDPDFGFTFTHGEAMFPDPWVRAAEVEPLFPSGIADSEPHMSLPFYSNQIWYYTGGPHGAWEREGAQAALDFAPSSTEPGCIASEAWVTAAAEGLVVRSEKGLIVVDWDGDGYEQTGWVILYLHLANKEHVQVGDWVDRGDQLGNPSCEGGTATATHLHIARKYNGEWIAASGPMPMVLSGWAAQSGGSPYLGSLIRGDQTIVACTCSNIEARIARSPEDPY